MATDAKKPKIKPYLSKPDDKLAALLDAEIKRMTALQLGVSAILAKNEELEQPAKVRLRKFTMDIAGEFLIDVAHTASVKQSCASLGISRTSYNNFIAKNAQGKRLWFTVQLLTNPKEKSRAKSIREYFDETYGQQPKKKRSKVKRRQT